MFEGMEWERDSIDYHDSELLRLEQLKSSITAAQLAHLEALDHRRVATGDGFRNLSEWVATRLDVSHKTAKTLVRTMRRTEHRPNSVLRWLRGR